MNHSKVKLHRSREERIAVAVSHLDDFEMRRHVDAINEGQEDEPCPRCEIVFLAYENVKKCGCSECPFKLSPSERRRQYPTGKSYGDPASIMLL